MRKKSESDSLRPMCNLTVDNITGKAVQFGKAPQKNENRGNTEMK